MKVVDRARRLLLEPRAEWAAIADERTSVQELYTRYVMVLAAIGPAATFVGVAVIGVSGFGFHYRLPLGAALAAAVLGYGMSLASVYVIAAIVDGLAPGFGGERDFLRAFKLAAHAPTALWLAGIFQLVPVLGLLSIVGLYSLYLLWLGLPVLMRVPDDKAIAYLIVVVVASLVAMAVIWTVTGLVLPSTLRGF